MAVMKPIKDLKINAVVSATYDTVLQILLRIISFILNAFIVRHVSSSVFAVMTVRLYLLYASGLLLSREAFRRAALGRKSSTDIRKLINLVWLGTAFSLPLSLLGWIVWCYIMEAPPDTVTVHYKSGVLLTIISFVIEVATEVPYVLSELHLWAKTKVLMEGLMHLLRSVMLAIGIYFYPTKAILVFGVAYVTGSLLYCVLYYSVYARTLCQKSSSKTLLISNFRSLLPSFRTTNLAKDIDSELWFISWSFFKQGWLKEALTEGELYLMNFFPLISLSQQGIYQVVNNLGSLAARLVFRSIEAASYKFFAQTLQRGVAIKDQEKERMLEVSKMLKSLFQNLMIISLAITVFGWSYSHTLLLFYGGTSLSEAGTTLMRAQCFYIIFLAINGITEAYTFAAMSDKELARHNLSLVLFSVVYVIATIIATQFLGALGFVIGNCINMLLRIVSSMCYIHSHYLDTDYRPIEAILVSKKVLLSFLVVLIFTSCSEIFLYPLRAIYHLIAGGLTFIWLTYQLRFDLQTPLEGLLNLADGLYCKLKKSVAGVTETSKQTNQMAPNIFYKAYFIDSIHWFLFRRKVKLKES